MALAAGRLRHRITIQKNTPTRTAGEDVPAWSKLATVNAEKTELRGSELFAAQQYNPRVTTLFVIRHRTDVDATQRVSFDGVLWDIHYALDPTGISEELHLFASRTS